MSSASDLYKSSDIHHTDVSRLLTDPENCIDHK